MKYKVIQRVETPQELIHIKHAISERQYKYWFILIKVFQECLLNGVKPNEKGFYSVPVAEIYKMIGYEVNKKLLKEDLFTLTSTGVAFNFLEKNGKEVFYGASFLSEFKLYSKTLKFRLPSFIQDVLEGNDDIKKMFLIMDWNIFNSFNGKYETIIYKLCKDYIGVGRTPYMSVKKYRDYIGLKDEEYKTYKSLRQWTITTPLKNINENDLSDIFVKVVLKKDGRNVVGLHFEMQYKSTEPLLEIAPPEPNPAFEKSLITIPPNRQIEYLGQFSEDQIKAIIDRANDYINKLKADGKKIGVGAIYNKAFAESWGLDNWEAEQKEKAEAEERKRQEKAKREAEERAKKEQEELIKKEEDLKKHCIDLFFELSEEEQKKIIETAEQRINSISLLSFLKMANKKDKKLWDSPIHYVQLKAILREKNMI